MKLAIMQPYFFPYEGYYDLISKVDCFVFLDDAQYTRRSWVNRNTIINSNTKLFNYITVPIKKSPVSSKINEIQIFDKYWVENHLKIFIHNYGKGIKNSSLFDFYYTLGNFNYLNLVLINSIKWIAEFYKLKTNFEYSSNLPSEKKGQERILDICKKFNATEYYNLPGGVKYYNQDKFIEKDIKLNFIDTNQYKKISFIDRYFRENTSPLCF